MIKLQLFKNVSDILTIKYIKTIHMKATQIKIEDLTFDPLLDHVFIEEKVEDA